VLTGTLRALTREEAADRIRRRGGCVSDGVTRRTDYVVPGANPGAKLGRARALGVPILGEDALLRLVR
jgi:DNA ligase (NAD+)